MNCWPTRIDAFADTTIAIDFTLMPEGPMTTLTYPTRDGWTHTVEYLDALGLDLPWEPMPEAPHDTGSLSDTNRASQRFYRLKLSSP